MKVHPLAIPLMLWVLNSSAHADQPGSKYELNEDNYPTLVSPDGTIQVENYSCQDGPDDRYLWQFWVFDREHKKGWLLNSVPYRDFGAGFRFTNDSQWLIREQKIGAGECTVCLYQRRGNEFSPEIALGDLAWKYFWSRPENSQVEKPDFHFGAFLVKGLKEDYPQFKLEGVKNRYLVLGLSGESDQPHQHTVLQDWFCAYDLETKSFSVLPVFSAQNAKAVQPQ